MTPDNTILVSIVMSIHNGENYVYRALNSIEGQTMKDYEVIIIDDASTDNTNQLLRAFCERDSKYHLIHNQTNYGLTNSLILGIQQAKGKYIARLDADDECLPHRLEYQYRDLEETGADINFCDAYVVKDDRVSIRRQYSRKITNWLSLFTNSYGLHSAVMFSKITYDELGGYNPNFKYAQDYELWDRFNEQKKHFSYTDIPLIRYYSSEESLSKTKIGEQEMYAQTISHRAIKRYLPSISSERALRLRNFLICSNPSSNTHFISALRECFLLLRQMHLSNVKNNYPWVLKSILYAFINHIIKRYFK